MQNTFIPKPDKKELRKFGLLMGTMIIGLFGLLLPFLFGAGFPYWPWLLGLIFIFWAIINPASLKIIYRLWMRFGLVMNRITTPIILGTLFYLVITPLAFIMRFIKRDVLMRQYDNETKSYRKKSEIRTRKSVERPF